ncbi:H/ACA ribonucleoprotein complex non-core subunit NAF1 [Ceratina calcarata]|uniref:H/ACA ribonucleoprotein complex non-core subunit NAF1 n=1 Tax=Ceratina calcarata TaxID=156304 RepID=A0AAJ7J1R1_9HYME|nr:H/ACA ribonucleoprotein complex non-core subunit NAF1 [Ceratina calcarata]
MDTNEIIIDQAIDNSSSNNELMEHVSNISKDIDVNTTENCSLICEDIPQNDVAEKKGLNDCEMIFVNNDNIQNCCDKNGINDTHQEENEFVHKETIFESSRLEDDPCIVYENSITSAVQESNKISSLSAIAIEYGSSDSEPEDETDQTKCEINQSEQLKEIQEQAYRQNKESSSSEESETESEDSDDDSSDSNDSSIVPIEPNESDSDDDSNKKRTGSTRKGQKNNEVRSELDDLPPIEDLKISVPEVLCDPLGEVAWMVEQLVVVKPKPEKPTLNLDTILFIQRGERALGKIFDVFGQVNEPHYCVRFNSSDHIKESDVKVGMTVYYCPNTEYTSLVFLHELLKMKGIDANADEPPEFSDDEEERAYYEQIKAKQSTNASQTEVPSKRKRLSKPKTGWQSNHPWNRNPQANRQNFYRRTDRQFSPMQSDDQSQNLWSQFYQSNAEQYGYGAYAAQPAQGVNQNMYASQNFYGEDVTTPLLNPRVPFNACPRIPSGYLSFQNYPNSSGNERLPNSHVPWPPPIPQFPMRMRSPWTSLPPPPPPPASSPSDTS